ncbi:MAG: response regulator [Spirochaetaceae bacterium]|nr:MAG: response regulator [Spirochaetaceae bacterium]
MAGSVLIVDDDQPVRAMLSAVLQDYGYHTRVAGGGAEAVRLVHAETPDIVLLDVILPDFNGDVVLHRVKEIDHDLPVVMMSSLDEVARVRRCLRDGAFDYLLKPLDITELVHTLEMALEHAMLRRKDREHQIALERTVDERTRELRGALERIAETYRSTILALGSALEMRDVETQAHSLRVSRYTGIIAEAMGIRDHDTLENMERGAYLHDIGKIAVPDSILLKKGALTDTEWELMRTHPLAGVRLLERIEFLHQAIPLVRSHHERWDGRGYPEGLRGESIPLEARIFAVADTFDAITSDRPYREGRSFQVARDEILRESGSQFDPEVVQAFLRIPEKRLRDAAVVL